MKKPFLGILLTALALGTGGLVLERLAIPALAAQDSSTPVVRSEQDSPSVTYGGAWSASSHSSFSGGDAVLSMDAGARATFTFTGSEVRWIGTRDEWSGIARVFLDGSLQAVVDGYASPGQTQALLYAAGGLAAVEHTLIIEVTGTHNPAANESWVWVDAFDLEE